MRRMRTGRDAAPAGSASSAGPPGASGVIARPNYVGPSGNGLVERMNAGRKPLRDQGDLENGSFRFQKAVPRTEEKRRGEAPIGAPARVMGSAISGDPEIDLAAKQVTGCGASAPAPVGALLPSLFSGSGKMDEGRPPPANRAGAALAV